MTYQSNNYPALTKSFKGRFPFKIGTTSFIYPDHYIPNVRMLGPYMDEIELLMFESRGRDALPSRAVIDELCRLAGHFDLSYNVHLPTDISISEVDPALQKDAVRTMIRVLKLVRPLEASALILHVPYNEKSFDERLVGIWRDRVYQNLLKIKSATEPQDIIAIETLDYPLELLANIVPDLDMRICLDLGHLMVYDYDILEVFNKYRGNISVIHLHGVENGRDHQSLDHLSENLTSTVLQILERFTGVVSLEVFSFEHLNASLKYIENHWEKLNMRDFKTNRLNIHTID